MRNPTMALRWMEIVEKHDARKALAACLESDWHMQDSRVARWVFSQIGHEEPYLGLRWDLIQRWYQEPLCPPEILVEWAKHLARISATWDEVKELFLKALSVGGIPFDTWMAMAYAATSRCPISDVLEYVRSALFARPGDPSAIAFLGGVLNEAGEHSSAVLCTSIAIRVFPDQGPYLLSHSLALEKLFRLDEAIYFAEAALARMPNNPEPYKHLAFCEIRASRAERALEVLRKAANIFTQNTVILSNLLYCENYKVTSHL